MIFFPGVDPHHAKNFPRCMVSVNRLRKRKSDFVVNDWLLDSGAFTEISRHGKYRDPVDVYAAQIVRWSKCGNMLAAVTQDYMCEQFILDKTGLTTADHQRLTIERYDALEGAVRRAASGERTPYIMPVLQGYWPDEYVSCIRQYGCRLAHGQWVGVGSVCKRNARIDAIEQVLMAVRQERPDLKLHGFGVKITALESSIVRDCLYSSDSMAWSFAARMARRNQHDWHEAENFTRKIVGQKVRHRVFQMRMF